MAGILQEKVESLRTSQICPKELLRGRTKGSYSTGKKKRVLESQHFGPEAVLLGCYSGMQLGKYSTEIFCNRAADKWNRFQYVNVDIWESPEEMLRDPSAVVKI